MKRLTPALAPVALILCASAAHATNPGTVTKYAQYPEQQLGENIGSDFDWRPPIPGTPPTPNWAVADDFPSQGFPVLSVRWWGSYFDPSNEPTVDATGVFRPTVEEGFALSFFRDIPAGPGGTFSRPGDLLGTYVAPDFVVSIAPTPLVGWDMHRVWEYRVDLKFTHLDHPSSADPIARPGSFNQRPGEIYWLSIAAWNGHRIDANWQAFDNEDPRLFEHFWGWHTSPQAFNDVATMGPLAMLPDGQWAYGPWNPIQPQHGLNNMAFELLTIPAPSTAALLAVAACIASRRRR
jgi:hypothetical protein